jgi:tetraacyldisaccharide-1-P 4'-kinase
VPGALVVVHPDRRRAAAHVLASVDLFILDDGGQVPVARDVDVLCVHPRHDPPWSSNPEAQREGVRRLAQADHVVAILDACPDFPPGVSLVSDVLRRRASGIRTLAGDPVWTEIDEAVLLTGVGDPQSVEWVARDAGIRRIHPLPLPDHGRLPAHKLREAMRRGCPVLTTEKDAVRWGSELGDLPSVLVLGQRIEGVGALWERVRAQLLLC